MDYASPEVQLLGLLTTLLVGALQIAAAIFLIRGRSAGPWLMLAGALLSTIAILIPQSSYLFVGWYSGNTEISTAVETLMYYSIWDWLALAANFLFAIGLLLTALSRRNQSRRITELESLLSQSAIPSAHLRH